MTVSSSHIRPCWWWTEMPLMPFSIPDQVPKLLSGEKLQTTRIAGQWKQGDIMKCWYKSRAKKTCYNCINPTCNVCGGLLIRLQTPRTKLLPPCSDHRNKLGEAKIERIRPLDFYSMSGEELEDWAVRDGFSDFQAADRWFSRTYNSDFWLKPEFDEIQFVPVWL